MSTLTSARSHSSLSKSSTQSSAVSDRKRAANRANAAKSTGPRTDAGKRAVAANAVRHGFYTDRFALGPAEAAAFDEYAWRFVRACGPRDELERLQAGRVAGLQWRLQRVEDAQNRLLRRSVREAAEEHELKEREQQKERQSSAAAWDGIVPHLPAGFSWDTPHDQLPPEHVAFLGPLYRGPKRDVPKAAAPTAEPTKPDAAAVEPEPEAEADPEPEVEAGEALIAATRGDEEAFVRLTQVEHRLDTQLQRAWRQLKALQDPKRVVVDIDEPVLEPVAPECRSPEPAVSDSETCEGTDTGASGVEMRQRENKATEIVIVEDTIISERTGDLLGAVATRVAEGIMSRLLNRTDPAGTGGLW